MNLTFILTRYKVKCDITNSSCFGFDYKWKIAILTSVEKQSMGCEKIIQ